MSNKFFNFGGFQAVFGAVVLAASAFGTGHVRAEEANTKCPMMTDDEVDEEKVVEFKGHKILLCCGKCEKAWGKSEVSAAYWAKVATELGLLPQLKGKEKELGFDDIKLMDQRFSAISFKTIITPESPTVEYKGQKVYVFNEKEVEKWNKDPEAAAKKAIDAGILPQLAAPAAPGAPATPST